MAVANGHEMAIVGPRAKTAPSGAGRRSDMLGVNECCVRQLKSYTTAKLAVELHGMVPDYFPGLA